MFFRRTRLKFECLRLTRGKLQVETAALLLIITYACT